MRQTSRWGRAPADAEGFRVVAHSKRGPALLASAPAASATRQTEATAAAAEGVDAERGRGAEDAHRQDQEMLEDEPGQELHGGGDDGSQEAANCEGEGDEPAHIALWRDLQKQREEARQLRRQFGAEHWTTLAAEERTAAVELAWRSERPAASSTRQLQRAEQAVRKADSKCKALEGKLTELDAEYWQRRQELEEQHDAAQEKLQEHQETLRLVRVQVGKEGCKESGSGAEGNGEDEQQVIRHAAEAIGTNIGPQLLEVAELMESNGDQNEAKQRLQAAVTQLHEMHGVLQERAQRAEPQHRGHYIADDESELPDLTPQDYEYYSWYTWEGKQGHSPEHQHGWYVWDQGWRSHNWKDRRSDWDGDDDRQQPRSKQRRVDDEAMDEQTYDQMQVPVHMDPNGKEEAATQNETSRQLEPPPPTGQTGTVYPEDTASQQQAQQQAQQQQQQQQMQQEHEAHIAEFAAAAKERGVDISDVDLSALTPESLRTLAEQRLK